MLTAVGFSSPPSWIKPYHVLSNGEQFRCDLARSLLGGECNGLHPATHLTSPASRPASPAPRPTFAPLAVFDEFTSVVDRNVARVVSAAIAKGIRGGQIGRRFVAVTCHYDVTEWLTPDWVLDMAAGTFQRRCLRRPAVAVSIVGCRRDAWRLFAPHHYLNGDLPLYSRCFLALWDGVPVAFCATVALIGRKNRRRISRIVTLPDYQGIGIGMAMAETVADLHRQEGLRLNLTCSHPAVIGHCRRSPRWRAVGVKKTGSSTVNTRMEDYRSSSGRAVVSFEYVGKPS